MIVYSVYNGNVLLVQCSDIFLANEFANRYAELLRALNMDTTKIRMQSETIYTVSSKLDIDECINYIKGLIKEKPKMFYGDRVINYPNSVVL